MGISRSSSFKRRATGAKKKLYRKKRKYELGRPPAMTKLVTGEKRIRPVRVRGGHLKFRALRLDTGNYSWGSEVTTRKTRILSVVYNASNNELVRTNTLVKGCIVQVDATPFRQWYEQRYGVKLGKTTTKKAKDAAAEEEKTKTVTRTTRRKQAKRLADHELDPAIADQFNVGRLYAAVSSRPGQSGRCDGYILEGKELDFYLRKISKKKGKQ
eukprot:TRINITY_DN7388_c0_g1_i1.p1 TRINITY_DN7388_c0_g1~~TRINITY_DN7388_c0_g1_i1.p1  ORF type:complete len:225 (-),score=60.11 TRINITY_DN7388_c0_g1_i1:209-847(-)